MSFQGIGQAIAPSSGAILKAKIRYFREIQTFHAEKSAGHLRNWITELNWRIR